MIGLLIIVAIFAFVGGAAVGEYIGEREARLLYTERARRIRKDYGHLKRG